METSDEVRSSLPYLLPSLPFTDIVYFSPALLRQLPGEPRSGKQRTMAGADGREKVMFLRGLC